MRIKPIRWRKDLLELLDQRLLPAKITYLKCRTDRDVWQAIKCLAVRGAPLIGIAGAYGAYLGIRKSRAKDHRSFRRDLGSVVKYIDSSRPTARNLLWALQRVLAAVDANREKAPETLKHIILKEARAIHREDEKMCRSIGRFGAALIKKGSKVLTHCNAGTLATGGDGTALGVIKAARAKLKMVYVDETRPLLQGARLTAWEMVKSGIPATLICDNMAGAMMAAGKVNAVIVGADRIAANGDAANKIGTYGLAVLANYHKIPFYVAAPSSTFDLSIRSGREIVIEERHPDEVRKACGKLITVKGMPVRNPAFDVTPAGLITAIITERGVIMRPSAQKVGKMIGSRGMGQGSRRDM